MTPQPATSSRSSTAVAPPVKGPSLRSHRYDLPLNAAVVQAEFLELHRVVAQQAARLAALEGELFLLKQQLRKRGDVLPQPETHQSR